MTHYELKKSLHTLFAQAPLGSIESVVLKEALESENAICFFQNVSRYGCVSGYVSSMIYYSDTHAFFDAHYDEIETLRYDFESMTGESLTIKGDLKNFFAWFAFEEVTLRIANELDIE